MAAAAAAEGWRVKGRDVLGPVDTAKSPEPSGAKIPADEDISSRERLNGETEARPRLLFAPSVPLLPRRHFNPASFHRRAS